jgi:hypothetical protein
MNLFYTTECAELYAENKEQHLTTKRYSVVKKMKNNETSGT